MIVPGGYSPDHLRRCSSVVNFVKQMNEKGKLIAAICHGGWVPISAQAVSGKKATAFFAIKDDMVNAGVEWLDLWQGTEAHLVSDLGVRFTPPENTQLF